MKQVVEDMKKNHENFKVGRIMIVDDESVVNACLRLFREKEYRLVEA